METGTVFLSELERRTIYELEKDCNISLKELGDKLGVSKRVAEYNMRSLIRKKAIVNFVAVIDVSKLGFINHEVWMQTGHMGQEKREAFVQYLVAHPRISWVASCGGKFDYVISIMAEDSVTFSEILKSILAQNPGLVTGYSITISTKIRTYPRSYMLGKGKEEREGSLFFSGLPNKEKLDATDLAILSVLSKNAKTTANEMSRIVGMSPGGVRMRIRSLEKSKVIEGYKAIFQPAVMGIQNYEILFSSAGLGADNEAKVDKYCKSNPYITLFIRCIGNFDMNLAADVRSQEHLKDIINDLKGAVGSAVQGIEIVPLLRVHKFSLTIG
ncbi:MAG TPA: Lrp/AsnC family transcriptional regulator [Candidatus Bilamarchaeum sp.]|nr:Lrp/AsnC family transcriptional regulator [Candidatus Bilamarchaeum sp.]